MVIVSKEGDLFEKQNPAYGLLRHTRVGVWLRIVYGLQLPVHGFKKTFFDS